MDEPAAKTGVVILNYNCRNLLDTCIGSVLTQTYPNTAVWVVDNGSTDGSVELVRQKFPRVNLIPTRRNVGFAGLNVGIQAALEARCRFVMYLDSDARLDPHTIDTLVRFLNDHPRCGVAGPQQCNYSTGQPHFVGARLDVRTMWPTVVETAETPVELDYLGNALVRGEILETLRFDERFFTYYADTDLCWQVRERGYTVMGVPAAKMYSLSAHTSSIVPGLRGYIPSRNRLLFIRKHTPRAFWPIALPLTFIDSLSRLAYWLARGEFRNAAFVLIGFASGLFLFFKGEEPQAWKELVMAGMQNRIVLSGSESGET